MEVQLFGAAKEVTGSCYSLVTENEKILIDCGMFQGSKESVRKNFEDFAFNPQKYDAMILTHAHLDHCGRIPKLVKQGFRGKIYCTNATKELAFIIMMDAAKIAAQDTEHENRRRQEQGMPSRKPIYNDVDVKNAIKLFKTISYDEDVKITKNIIARYYDAGHILGAASVQLEIKEGSKTTIVVFSGDLGQSKSIIVRNIEPIKRADYVFIESTYGNRLHPPIDERKKDLLKVINETYNRGGKLMIPSFAVERAQEILYCIAEFLQDKKMPKMPIYLDSPMAMKATEVFTKFPEYYNEEVKHSLKERDNPFNFPELINTESVQESKKINSVKKPCVIIAGNGMCSSGRIKHHIRNNISDAKNTLLFIGYQAKGSLGYWIKQKEKIIRLLGTQVKVNSKIESIDGFSAHADYNELLRWLDYYSPKPKKIFICHGEVEETQAFSKRLDEAGLKNYVPSEAEKIEL